MRAAIRRGFSTVLVLLAAVAASAQDARLERVVTVPVVTRNAFSLPVPDLTADALAAFTRGRSLFNQVWIIAPAVERNIAGLGPTFNEASCAACHLLNGRGRPSEGPAERMRSMLVRLSIAGTDPHGGPRPHAVYGDQLNDEGIPGVPHEGQAALEWLEHEETFADGSRLRLRRPRLRLFDLQFGDVDDALLTSARVAPALVGVGLLDAVPEAAILALAERQAAAGEVSGRPNYVWDAQHARRMIGRFGWKANVATLEHQTAGAFLGDLGLTSKLFPEENCPPVQDACRRAPAAGSPELTAAQLRDVVFYQQALAVPARRATEDPAAQHGERVFLAAGCGGCHVPELETGPSAHAWLSERRFEAYTDLLLHDMGEDLGDGRPDFEATGTEWRTPPLWGLGLVPSINEHVTLLHDGRARGVLEAVMWHGGEAQAARERVRALSAAERAALVRFVESL